MQHTLAHNITFNGVGLHSGQPATLVLMPSDANSGIMIERVDLPAGENLIEANFKNVTDTRLCTLLSNEHGATVSTVEHLMAALAGLGVDNVHAQIDGPEIPILDGSSLEFVRAILEAGLHAQKAPRRAIKILREVEISFDDVTARLSPADQFSIEFMIDFPEPVIGRQEKTLQMRNGAFLRELANCRTFCRLSEVEYLQSIGLAQGGSLKNAVVVEKDKVLNPGGFRRSDECVRHKMLDALGDLYLAAAPIIARYDGVRAGHRATNELLHALFAAPDAWEYVEIDDQLELLMPGSDIKPSDLVSLTAA